MENRKSLGEQLTPILEEIEMTLLENYETPPEFPLDGFRAIVYIFQQALADKFLESGDPSEAGKEIKELVFKYTGIDTFKLFE